MTNGIKNKSRILNVAGMMYDECYCAFMPLYLLTTEIFAVVPEINRTNVPVFHFKRYSSLT